ncbi:MAG: glycoside hydrolase domain-containing protein [Chloroflexota bacterium]
MKYGLDCVTPPMLNQGQAMLNLGWSWLNVYVGGPYLSGHTPWSNASVGALAGIGFVFLPLYVGQQNVPGNRTLRGTLNYEQGTLDGTEATVLTGACGFDSSTLLGLHLESGNYEHDPDGVQEYVRGWVEVVNGAGHQALLYSNAMTAHVLGTPSLVDLTWVSDPVVPGSKYRRAPEGRFDPSSDPAWDAWQFAFGGQIGGVSVDLNSARDDFPFASQSQ